MKLSCLGADANALCQIPALRQGFAELGHIHVPDPRDSDASFVFVGNPPFDQYLDLTKEKKTIFNVLDLANHCPEHPEIVARLREQLPLAGRVTAISKTVARQVEDLCQVKCETIYYPMKPVRYTGEKKYPQFRAMMLGRLRDPNKRAHAAVMSLIRAGFEEHEVAIVGPEPIGWGVYQGILSDQDLNDLYNSVDYVLMFGREEGIGLPACESACAGAIPIVLPDLSTFDEFWVQSPLGLHYQTLTSPAKVAELIMALERDKDWKAQVKQDVLAYGEITLRPKFTARNVAARIIESYHLI